MKRKALLITLFLVVLLIPTLSSGALFTGSADLGSGWKWSPWFGYYNDTNSTFTGSQGWVYHEQHEWLYSMENPGGGLFLWGEATGWWWTSATLYPYVYSFDAQSWLFYSLESTNPRWFYNYQLARWQNIGGVASYNWIGNWVQVNFLSTDDNGVWDADDLSGIGFVAKITGSTWTETDDHGYGCSVTFSYTVNVNNEHSKQAVSLGSSCPSMNISLLQESGRLVFSSDNQFMYEYFNLGPGDDIVAFKWMRQ